MATTQSRPSCNEDGGGTRRTAGRRRRRRPSGPQTSPVGGGGAGREVGGGEEAAVAVEVEPGDACGNCFPTRSDSCLFEVRGSLGEAHMAEEGYNEARSRTSIVAIIKIYWNASHGLSSLGIQGQKSCIKIERM